MFAPAVEQRGSVRIGHFPNRERIDSAIGNQANEELLEI
jgi:hypothetical protein